MSRPRSLRRRCAIPVPAQCRNLIERGALVAVNSSGGRDSQCMTILARRRVEPMQVREPGTHRRAQRRRRSRPNASAGSGSTDTGSCARTHSSSTSCARTAPGRQRPSGSVKDKIARRHDDGATCPHSDARHRHSARRTDTTGGNYASCKRWWHTGSGRPTGREESCENAPSDDATSAGQSRTPDKRRWSARARKGQGRAATHRRNGTEIMCRAGINQMTK